MNLWISKYFKLQSKTNRQILSYIRDHLFNTWCILKSHKSLPPPVCPVLLCCEMIFFYTRLLTASCNTCTLPSQVSKEADCVKSSSHEQKVDENVVRAVAKLSSSSPSVQPAEVRSLAIPVPSNRLLRTILVVLFIIFGGYSRISGQAWVTINIFPTESPVHIICYLKHKRSWLQAPGNHWLGRESWKMVKFHWTPN